MVVLQYRLRWLCALRLGLVWSVAVKPAYGWQTRINAVLRSGDACGRYGGDEFIVVLRGGPNDNLNEILIERIMMAVSTPMLIDGHQIKVTCSFGLSVFPTHGGSADTLIDHADKAMYHAKQAGSNVWRFYSEHNASQSP